MIQKIEINNSKILRTKCVDLNLKDKKSINEIINDLYDTLKSTSGIGLSAPQIGINKNIFIVIFNEYFQVFINPKIREYYGETKTDVESCLSLPNIEVSVPRRKGIIIDYYDGKLKLRIDTIDNFVSRIIQHEYDHLQGKLITDYKIMSENQ